MFLLETAAAAALAADSYFGAGWHVREGFEGVERHSTPALNVRTTGAQVAASAGAGVRIEVVLGVAIVIERSAQVTQQLDAAMAAAIASLHGRRLQDSSGRHWSALQLAHIREAALLDGLGGCELLFTASARYAGVPCDA